MPEGVEPIVGGGIEERTELLTSPRLSSRPRHSTRRIRKVARVPYDAAPADGIPECSVQHDVDVLNRPLTESMSLGRWREQSGVERVQVWAIDVLQCAASYGILG
jgi:hypothetical protein